MLKVSIFHHIPTLRGLALSNAGSREFAPAAETKL